MPTATMFRLTDWAEAKAGSSKAAARAAMRVRRFMGFPWWIVAVRFGSPLSEPLQPPVRKGGGNRPGFWKNLTQSRREGSRPRSHTPRGNADSRRSASRHTRFRAYGAIGSDVESGRVRLAPRSGGERAFPRGAWERGKRGKA